MQKLENYEANDVVYAQPVQARPGYRPYEPPTGGWRDDFCNCFSNLWPSCCCVFLGGYSGLCLPMYLAGQISTRIGFWTTEKTIKIYIGVICLFWLLSIIVGAATKNTGGAVFLLYVPYLFAFFFLMYLRFLFVKHYQINESGMETFCVSFWCSPCSLCQMARHQYGYERRFDGDSQLDGRQVYSSIAV